MLRFWFGEGAEYGKAHKRWFDKDPAFDAEVKKRFARLHDELARNRAWLLAAFAAFKALVDGAARDGVGLLVYLV